VNFNLNFRPRKEDTVESTSLAYMAKPALPCEFRRIANFTIATTCQLTNYGCEVTVFNDNVEVTEGTQSWIGIDGAR